MVGIQNNHSLSLQTWNLELSILIISLTFDQSQVKTLHFDNLLYSISQDDEQMVRCLKSLLKETGILRKIKIFKNFWLSNLFQYGDWFLLRQMAKNVEAETFDHFLTALGKDEDFKAQWVLSIQINIC